MTRAAVYTRVSTDDQACEGFSLDEQEYRGLQLIAREDAWEHAGTYCDPGRSGADRDRPDLRRLLAGVAAERVDVVIVAALDRLSRDAGHLRELLLTFDAAGIRVIASGQALDRDTPEGILQTGILAEFERRKIKARTKAGIPSRARTSGKPWGTHSPTATARPLTATGSPTRPSRTPTGASSASASRRAVEERNRRDADPDPRLRSDQQRRAGVDGDRRRANPARP
jgi:DNA invertase Pin-like site-specific DNA recombinase